MSQIGSFTSANQAPTPGPISYRSSILLEVAPGALFAGQSKWGSETPTPDRKVGDAGTGTSPGLIPRGSASPSPMGVSVWPSENQMSRNGTFHFIIRPRHLPGW